MQRVDLIVNGVTKAVNQKSDSLAFQRRVAAAYQRNARVVVARHAAPPSPPPPPPPSSMWSGRGAFCTTNPASAAGLHLDWCAIQVDPEGRDGDVPGRKVWWQSRPTAARMVEANSAGIPYIAEVESLVALTAILELFDAHPIHVPHAFVGLVDRNWPAELRAKAVAQGWDLLREWYWVNTPSQKEPDGEDYPLFRNVVFGTFGAETDAGKAYWPDGRCYVDQQRAVWHGPFSAWDTEGMTDRDRSAFNVP